MYSKDNSILHGLEDGEIQDTKLVLGMESLSLYTNTNPCLNTIHSKEL